MISRFAFALGLSALAILSACASTSARDETGSLTGPSSPPPAISAGEVGAATTAPALTTSPETRAGETSPLTLQRVLAIAFESNPTFAEFAANREAARAEVIQALAYPNPEIEGSLGQATTRATPKETKAEYGVSLIQPLESPTKRRTRRAAAEAEEGIVVREEEVFRVTLRAETAKAYFTLLYRQRAANLAESARQIAEEIEAVVGRRVDSGEAPEIDRIKARVEVLKASRAVQSEKRLLASARAILSALCGGALPESFQISDSLADELKAADTMQFALEGHPVLARLQAERGKQEAVIAREKAAWRPDLKPGISLGRQIDTDTAGVSLGVEIPIWNRNQGGIAAAQAELKRIDAEIEKARLEIQRDADTALQGYESAREQIAAFTSGLRSGAAESLKIETFLYEQGEANFLELLDARRTAQDTESEYLQALFDGATASAELEEAIGKGKE